MSRTTWEPVIEHAADIVRSYDTSVTLRQLFYRLVSEQLINDTPAAPGVTGMVKVMMPACLRGDRFLREALASEG